LTTIFVTHDQQEAVMLADRVALMFNGQLQQYAPPRELYTRPASCAIAKFFGNQNFIQGVRRGSLVETAFGPVCLREPSPEGPVTLTIRPERVQIAPANGHAGLMGEVVKRTYVGTHLRVSVRLSTETVLDALTDAMHEVTLGERVQVTLPAEALWPLPQTGAVTMAV
jgi:ABC-type Fe3+/spermidine/putrescine transport system ATPase subunit